MSSQRHPLPPLNALRAFEAAGRKLSFRAAADELCVTQGAVAQQVRSLEDRLGFALFQRQPRGLVLTERGAAYFAEVTRAFDILGDATARLHPLPEAVTISVTPTFASKLLLPRLPLLNATLNNLELRMLATEALADLERDPIDIAVRLTRPPFPSTLEARLLFAQELVPVASPHLIGTTSLPIAKDQLATWPLLHDAHRLWSHYLGIEASLPGARFNQTALALDAALAGQGIALACHAFVQGDLDGGRLIQVAPSQRLEGPEYYLVRKRTRTPSPAAAAVWNWCIENLSLQEASAGD